jgi:nicotinamidase-related amidase
MLMDIKSSCLLVVDIQEKLTPLVMAHEKLVASAHWLMGLARELDVSVLVTEQYPKGLGKTVETLRPLMVAEETLEKVHFSVGGDETCLAHLKALNVKQCILTGMETSVCILQTALDLKEKGYDVFVVADAVSARYERDHNIALNRMRDGGIHIVTKEMVFFEWLRLAGTAKFKALSKSFIQG